MFQRWADKVAEIPVTPEEAAARASGAPQAVAAQKDQQRSLSIAVVDPLEMPNAKAAGLRAAIAVVDRVSKVSMTASDQAGLRSAMEVAAPMVGAALASDASKPGRTVQLASFADEASARRAWASLVASHPEAFRGLAPRFERADLGDRGVWVRLKVGPVAGGGQAATVCRAAGVSDGWCGKT